MNKLRLTAAAVLLGSALLASCGGAGVTIGPGLSFTPPPGNSNNDDNDGGTTPVSGSDHTVIVGDGDGSSDTDLNLPGTGGADHGASYMPAITLPAPESFTNDAAPGEDDVQAWIKNCVETLPDGSSGVFQNESLQNWAFAIFEATNRARVAAGLAPLEYEPNLEVLAQAHARDMALRNYFSHDCPDGVLMWDRWQALRVPYVNWAGENAAMGQETAQEVVDQWLSSPGHRRNMMHAEAQYCAVGVYFDASDSSMPIKVIAEYANFRDDPASHDWYQRGEVYR
jgi:uncharacterized protein YkwD